jgi:hypothetical protein
MGRLETAPTLILAGSHSHKLHRRQRSPSCGGIYSRSSNLFGVGADSATPSIWIREDKGTVIPHRRFHWGFIPGGNALEMAKEDREWYFTGKLFID